MEMHCTNCGGAKIKLQIFKRSGLNKILYKKVIPFALVRFEIGSSELSATHLVGHLPSHIQQVLKE